MMAAESLLHSIEPDLLSKTIRTNLDGSFYAVQAAARQMASQSPSGGSIMAVSSISALVGGGQQTHYTPTKAGILSLMQSCAIALGKHGIRCNALLPGTIETQLNEKDLENEEKRKYMEGRIPLGRTGVTEDMVGPAVFLASDMSRYVVSKIRSLSLCPADLGRLEPNYWLMEGCSSTYNEEPSTYEWRPIPETNLSKFTSRLAVIEPIFCNLPSGSVLLHKRRKGE